MRTGETAPCGCYECDCGRIRVIVEPPAIYPYSLQCNVCGTYVKDYPESDTPGFDAGFEVGGTTHKPPARPEGEAAQVGTTVFQWLIERGQPEQQVPTVWLEHSLDHPARDRHWTTNAREAAMFPTREAAEEYIAEHFTSTVTSRNALAKTARAVEHGFMSVPAVSRPEGDSDE